MVLDSGGFANAYQCGIRTGRRFELKQATWAFKQAALSPIAKNNAIIAFRLKQEDIHQWFNQMPWKAGHSPTDIFRNMKIICLNNGKRVHITEYWQQLGIYGEGCR